MIGNLLQNTLSAVKTWALDTPTRVVTAAGHVTADTYEAVVAPVTTIGRAATCAKQVFTGVPVKDLAGRPTGEVDTTFTMRCLNLAGVAANVVSLPLDLISIPFRIAKSLVAGVVHVAGLPYEVADSIGMVVTGAAAVVVAPVVAAKAAAALANLGSPLRAAGLFRAAVAAPAWKTTLVQAAIWALPKLQFISKVGGYGWVVVGGIELMAQAAFYTIAFVMGEDAVKDVINDINDVLSDLDLDIDIEPPTPGSAPKNAQTIDVDPADMQVPADALA